MFGNHTTYTRTNVSACSVSFHTSTFPISSAFCKKEINLLKVYFSRTWDFSGEMKDSVASRANEEEASVFLFLAFLNLNASLHYHFLDQSIPRQYDTDRYWRVLWFTRRKVVEFISKIIYDSNWSFLRESSRK